MNTAALRLGATLFTAVAIYDIVALSYASNGFAQYSATCANGQRFEIVYDSGWESYRLSLGENYATFDLAAARACNDEHRTATQDQMGTGWGNYLPSNMIPATQ